MRHMAVTTVGMSKINSRHPISTGFPDQPLIEPCPGIRPVAVRRALGDAQKFGDFGEKQAEKLAQVDEVRGLGVNAFQIFV